MLFMYHIIETYSTRFEVTSVLIKNFRVWSNIENFRTCGNCETDVR